MLRKINAVLAAGMTLAMSLAVAAPTLAQNSRQKDKNNMRNLGIGLGAAAAHQALKGKTTNAIVLGAGAAYSAKKYEDARKAQNRDNARRYSRSRGSYRVYRYSNGKRIGYYQYRNGKRTGYHSLR